MKTHKVFAINPGSTSTKIALFHNEDQLYSKVISHDAQELAPFKEITDQLEYRKERILDAVKESGYALVGCDAFVGRGGSLVKLESGTYEANDVMLEHLRNGIVGFHPSSLGVLLCHRFAEDLGGRVFMVNGPSTDEFQDVARITGFADVYRVSLVHALNQKEVGIRYAASVGKRYKDLNLVIAHIGGGITTTAHSKGRMIDSNDVLNGDGPMTPTRSGTLPATEVVRICYSGKYTQRELYDRITKNGGLLDHLGTSDAREIKERIRCGDAYAKLLYDTMIYQIAKSIGAYATALKGNVDAIILTGGIVNDKYVVDEISSYVGYIAPLEVMAGEFEMEALNAGALRVLQSIEKPKGYTGEPTWAGFSFDV